MRKKEARRFPLEAQSVTARKRENCSGGGAGERARETESARAGERERGSFEVVEVARGERTNENDGDEDSQICALLLSDRRGQNELCLFLRPFSFSLSLFGSRALSRPFLPWTKEESASHASERTSGRRAFVFIGICFVSFSRHRLGSPLSFSLCSDRVPIERWVVPRSRSSSRDSRRHRSACWR